jgi:hypothetical protein
MPATATRSRKPAATPETESKPSPRRQHVTDVVTLVGFQAVFQPSKYGHTLSTILPDELIEVLEDEREEKIEYIKGKLKNPRRGVLKPEPWQEAEDGEGFTAKFTWKPEDHDDLPIVDSDGTRIEDLLPLYEGSQVRLAFVQKPYILKDNVTYGTTLKLKGIQVLSVCSGAGTDGGSLDEEEAASLFGKTKGFKVGDPNVRPLKARAEEEENEEDDDDATEPTAF